MKYAIIADIHGNEPALTAVLADAKEQGVDRYLLLGDYASGFTFCNEVTEIIRNLENAVIIGGNREIIIRTLQTSNNTFIDHSRIIPWSYENLTSDNKNYLLSLPETAVDSESGKNIYLNHHLYHIKDIFFEPIVKLFISPYLLKLFLQSSISHDEILKLAREEVLSDPQKVKTIKALPEGIYLFGHCHVQFHMEYDGKLFINPGSCGDSLDGNPDAAYTLLEDGVITERRVKYDINKTIENLRQSSFFNNHNPIWGKLLIKNIQTGLDYLRAFYSHVNKTADKLGESGIASNECVEEAIRSWEIKL